MAWVSRACPSHSSTGLQTYPEREKQTNKDGHGRSRTGRGLGRIDDSGSRRVLAALGTDTVKAFREAAFLLKSGRLRRDLAIEEVAGQIEQ